MTNRPVHRPTSNNQQQGNGNNQQNNQDTNTNQNTNQDQNQSNNGNQDNNQNQDSQNNNQDQNNNPYNNQVQQAQQAADAARTARDNAATAYANARRADGLARNHLTQTQRSAREAHGAVVGTEAAQQQVNQRVQDAQTELNNATQHRDQLVAPGNFADVHAEATDNLLAAQENLHGQNPDVTRRAAADVRRLNDLVRRLDDAAAAVNQANQNLTDAQADATTIQASVTAARTAQTTADNAVTTAQQAVNTTSTALNQATDNFTTANAAAQTANDTMADVRAAADSAYRANTQADQLTEQANDLNQQIGDLTDARDELTDQINDIDQQTNTIQQQLNNLSQNDPNAATYQNQLNDLAQQRQGLDDQRSDLNRWINREQTRAQNLTDAATEARNQRDDDLRDITTLGNQINNNRDAAQAAATAANTNQDNAQQAEKDAKKAKDDAKEAAKQGEVERGLTLLSGMPPNSRVNIETLGPLDTLVNAIANLTGRPRDDVNTQLTNLGTDGLANAINEGKVQIDTPNGKVDVAIKADLHRPADTTKAAQHQQPASTKNESAAESAKPLSESTGSSMPIRVPIAFISPIDLAGGAMRPLVYVGAAVKRSQKFDSTTTTSSTTSTERTTHVPTTMAITATVPGQDPVVAPVQAGLRVPDITIGSSMPPAQIPAGVASNLKPAPVTMPPAFVKHIGTSPDAFGKLQSQLLAGNQNPVQVDVNGTQVDITPTNNPSLTYVGTTGVDHTNSTSHSNSSSTTRGSDAVFGGGVYGGLKGWFVGLFADFSTGLTDGTNPANEHASSHTSSDTELIYRIDRDMRVGDQRNGPVETISSTVQVPVHEARRLNLPLPPHLTSTPQTNQQNQNNQQSQNNQNNQTQPNPQQEYIFGKDDIRSVRSDQVVDFVADGLGDKGRDAVADKFNTPERARDAIYNAMHGGEQAVWQEDGRTHVVEFYARPAPPTSTDPSGMTSTTAEDKNSDQFRRTYDSKRTARFGVGGAYLPVGTDSPNPSPPKATPENGLPNPYQGGPTTSAGAPRAAISATWDGGISNKSGYTGKEGRGTKFDGDIRDFDGPLDITVVHRSIKTPNWAQDFVLGGRMLLGPDSTNRATEPSHAEINQAFNSNESPSQHIRTGTVDDAITVSTPADKLPWATKPLPKSTMTPGIYLHNPPPVAADVTVKRNGLGEFTATEHVRVTPNTTEGVYIALAKRVEPVVNGPDTVSRKPPAGSGNWSTWSQRNVTESGTNTQYTYKNSELTRPGTTSGDAVRDFVGRTGSRGTATQTMGGQKSGTGKMIQPGRLQDFNGELKATAEYSSPRLVDLRAEGVLKRNQAGDSVAGSTKSNGISLDGEVSLGVAPKRNTGTGALLRAVLGGGFKWGKSHAVDLTTGGKQAHEYKGPTAFVVMDVRYQYAADMNLRNVFKTNEFTPLQVTVDQPDGVLVEMPVAHAIDLFNNLGMDVPPELTAALPKPKTPMDNPAQTLLPKDDGYVSYSDTTVIRSSLSGDNPLQGVENTLDQLGVDSKKWRAEILDQVNKQLTTPGGHEWLRDVLPGQQGNGGLISVPNTGVAFEDVIDIRVTATPRDATPDAAPVTPIVPDKQSNAGYVTAATQDKKNTAGTFTGGLEVGMNHREVPSVPPAPPGSNTVAQPNPGATSGSITPQILGGSVTVKNDDILPTSGSDKVNTQSDTNKLGRTSHAVDYHLDITRRRSPMPSVDTTLLGVPRQINWDKLGGTPVTLPGTVDLVSPSADASPPLKQPETAPTIEAVRNRPPRNPMFGPKDGFRVESIGADTVKAIHDGAYSSLGSKQLPIGQPASPQAVTNSVGATSDYTRLGSNAEYVLHNGVKGSAIHNSANAIFTGDSHHVENILGRKGTFYDSLYDLTLTADFRPDSFTMVKPLPDGTTMNLSQDAETAKPEGHTKTVTTNWGPSLPWAVGNTHNTGAPLPTNVTSSPPASEGISKDTTTATSGKTAGTTGVKHSGRSYLFAADADFYVEAKRHGSNWVQHPYTAMTDFFKGRQHQPNSVVKIGSTQDMHVRVWENTALDKGLLTIADVWQHQNKQPGDGLTVTSTSDGAVIHRSGQPAPAPVAPEPGGPRGRNLQVGPGVTQADVDTFVNGLPEDMRPTSFTHSPPQTTTDSTSTSQSNTSQSNTNQTDTNRSNTNPTDTNQTNTSQTDTNPGNTNPAQQNTDSNRGQTDTTRDATDSSPQDARNQNDNSRSTEPDPAWENQVEEARDVLSQLPEQRQHEVFHDAVKIVHADHVRPMFVETPTPEQVAKNERINEIGDVVMRELHENGADAARDLSRDLGRRFDTLRTSGLGGGLPGQVPDNAATSDVVASSSQPAAPPRWTPDSVRSQAESAGTFLGNLDEFHRQNLMQDARLVVAMTDGPSPAEHRPDGVTNNDLVSIVAMELADSDMPSAAALSRDILGSLGNPANQPSAPNDQPPGLNQPQWNQPQWNMDLDQAVTDPPPTESTRDTDQPATTADPQPQRRETVTLKEANDIYQQLAELTFNHPDGELRIPTEHPEDGCYIRAHIWAEKLRDLGIEARKVFVGRDGKGLVTNSANAFGATKDAPGKIEWRYHVAPLIRIDLGNDGPPLEVVLDPAMDKGVVPVRKWIESAGVVDKNAFDEMHLYEPQPYTGYDRPLNTDETRVMITDFRAIYPPWLTGTHPMTQSEAAAHVATLQDTARNYSVEAAARRDFRDWHQSLSDESRARFNQLNNNLDDIGKRDFHQWFRSLNETERDTFGNTLGQAEQVTDLVPAWEDRVNSAQKHLGKMDPDTYTTTRSNAETIVTAYNLVPADRGNLFSELTDVVMHRLHTDGWGKAMQLAERLATEHNTGYLAGLDPASTTFPPAGTTQAGTIPPVQAGTMPPPQVGSQAWWNQLSNTAFTDLTGNLTADNTMPAVPWTFDPNDPLGILSGDPAFTNLGDGSMPLDMTTLPTDPAFTNLGDGSMPLDMTTIPTDPAFTNLGDGSMPLDTTTLPTDPAFFSLGDGSMPVDATTFPSNDMTFTNLGDGSMPMNVAPTVQPGGPSLAPPEASQPLPPSDPFMGAPVRNDGDMDWSTNYQPADSLGAPWQPSDTETPAPQESPPAEQSQPEQSQPEESRAEETTPRPGKRSRDEFEENGGPVTVPEPRPMPERFVPPSPADTTALLDAVPPGTRFADPDTFVELINGTRSETGRDVNCVDAILAFHETYHGNPRVAGSLNNGVGVSGATMAAEKLSYAPELLSRGSAGVAEVISRITEAGHGADALVFGFPRQGRGHGWNVVNHNGKVSIVDPQAGWSKPATPDVLPGLDRVYAIPLDANGEFITGTTPNPPTPPTDPDPYAVAEYERAADVHRMRTAAAAGEEIPVRGTTGRLVPSLGGLRLIGATITAEIAAELSGMLGRDIIALVIGPDAEYPEFLKFSPRGRPLPVTEEEVYAG